MSTTPPTRIVENAGGGSDSVYASVSYALAAGQEIELLLDQLLCRDQRRSTSPATSSPTRSIGNAGANILDGKGGNDTLIGLGGADTFAFTTALGAGNVDNVIGLRPRLDKIALDDAVFAGDRRGRRARRQRLPYRRRGRTTLDDRIIYNSATGQLFFDADGSGAGAAVLFANLSPGLGLTASDFLVI